VSRPRARRTASPTVSTALKGSMMASRRCSISLRAVGAVACLGKDVGDDKVQVERDVEEVALFGLAKQAVWRVRTKPFAR